jgi:DNA replication and repair protein RecF
MRISSLHLEQFRAYDFLDLALGGNRHHLFMGENGAGKTNLLEAVTMLSQGKTFQPVEEAVLRRWGSEHYKISADLESDAAEAFSLETVSQELPRRARVHLKNGVRVPLSSFIGLLPTVLFLPQDLGLFQAEPGERRRFLDRVLSQSSPSYRSALAAYERCVKQRNSLLRRIGEGSASEKELPLWDSEVAMHGGVITLARLELLETWSLAIGHELETLGEAWKDVKIRCVRQTNARNEGALRAEMLILLTENRAKDLLLGTTSIGPHREDWRITVEGRDITTFASRGQQRTVLLALIALKAEYLLIKRGERPVILLDDVYSELDNRRQQAVCQVFREHQVLLTSTHVPVLLPSDTAVWRVSDASIEPQEVTISTTLLLNG